MDTRPTAKPRTNVFFIFLLLRMMVKKLGRFLKESPQTEPHIPLPFLYAARVPNNHRRNATAIFFINNQSVKTQLTLKFKLTAAPYHPSP
ncbi:MAG: hypothetical protein M0T76_06805, partial [Desulfobacteraceae bacterium]|nr:hypothetical protein [Desulfobacteraceae bacterium]